MWFRPTTPKAPALSPADQLLAVPLRNAKAEVISDNDLQLTLRVALIHRGWAKLARRFFTMKDYRIFELTDLDLLLHRWSDGKTTVGTMIERLAADEQLGWNESRAIVLSYLPRLTQRGLLVVAK